MKTFVMAMECEAEAVIRHLKDAKEQAMFGRRTVRGLLGGEEAFVAVSGIGKGNAAATAQMAIQATGADAIWNIGVAGGVDADMEVGAIYTVSSAVQYDFDLTMVNGTETGTLDERDSPFIPCEPDTRFAPAILGSGDRFNDSAEDTALLRRLGAKLRDMEGAAIAHVCEKARVKCVMVKCVSDVQGSGATPEQYKRNLAACIETLSGAFAPRA